MCLYADCSTAVVTGTVKMYSIIWALNLRKANGEGDLEMPPTEPTCRRWCDLGSLSSGPGSCLSPRPSAGRRRARRAMILTRRSGRKLCEATRSHTYG